MVDFFPDSEKLIEIKLSFQAELEKAKKGEESSLSYLRHKLPSQRLVEEGGKFQVLSVGGTYLVSAMAMIVNGKIQLTDTKKLRLPDISSKQVFLDLMEESVDFDVELLALNFGYPMKAVYVDDYLDGVLLRKTKNHSFEGMIGEVVGQLVCEHLLEKRGQKLKVSTANDTICLALSGLSEVKASKIAGLILGTGCNMALFEGEDVVVNLESGNFDKFELSEAGREVDANSNNKQKQLFEKEISGGYLYQQVNFLAKKQGLELNLTKSEELNGLCRDELSLFHKIAMQVMAKSACFVASSLAAMFDFVEEEELRVFVEGGVYWQASFYKEMVDLCLDKTFGLKGKIVFGKIKNSSLIGPAYLMWRDEG